MPYPVKWLSADMAGAPSMATANDIAPGAFIALLQACLINGFNDITPTTMTFAAGKITATFAAPHGFLPYQIVRIANVVEAGYNGDQRVDSVPTTTTLTIIPEVAPTVSPATTLTTISIKTPPLDGWVQTYYDAPTHNVVFSRSNPNATDYKLRVFNAVSWSTNTTYGNWLAKVDVITDYVDEANHTLQRTMYWPASCRYGNIATATYPIAVEWMLIGDDLMFYWIPRFTAAYRCSAYVFGDINSVVEGDRHHCMVMGCSSDGNQRWNNASTYACHSALGLFKSTYVRYLMRAYNAAGGKSGTGIATGTGSVVWDLRGYFEASFGQYVTYPNPANNGLLVFKGPLMITETNNVRGYLPGVMQPLSAPITILHKNILTTLPGLEGIPVLLWKVSYSANNDVAETLGAWRLDNWRVV
jgi:hypothetical protein